MGQRFDALQGFATRELFGHIPENSLHSDDLSVGSKQWCLADLHETHFTAGQLSTFHIIEDLPGGHDPSVVFGELASRIGREEVAIGFAKDVSQWAADKFTKRFADKGEAALQVFLHHVQWQVFEQSATIRFELLYGSTGRFLIFDGGLKLLGLSPQSTGQSLLDRSGPGTADESQARGTESRVGDSDPPTLDSMAAGCVDVATVRRTRLNRPPRRYSHDDVPLRTHDAHRGNHHRQAARPIANLSQQSKWLTADG